VGLEVLSVTRTSSLEVTEKVDDLHVGTPSTAIAGCNCRAATRVSGSETTHVASGNIPNQISQNVRHGRSRNAGSVRAEGVFGQKSDVHASGPNEDKPVRQRKGILTIVFESNP